MKSFFTLYSLWAAGMATSVKETAQIAHKNVRTILVFALAMAGLWIAPAAAAQGVAGMFTGITEAVEAGIDFLVLLALLLGVISILYGLKLIVDKSNERADVKGSHIAVSLIGGAGLCMIWFIITVLVETAGGSSSDIGAAASY